MTTWFAGTGRLDWRIASGCAAVLAAGLSLYKTWRDAPCGQVGWDGAVWRWESAKDGTESSEQSLSVVADFQKRLVLVIESNLWAYSTPSDMQYGVKDLADRAIGYGIPGVIVDGTDPMQVYDACHEACERARRGDGATLIEAKMMRMKGHAIHDAADYVPKPMFEYWKKRDPITRLENFLIKEKKWLSASDNEKLIAEVERHLEAEREIAVNSPMPTPESAAGGVYCDEACHQIKPRYAVPKDRVLGENEKQIGLKRSDAPVHFK